MTNGDKTIEFIPVNQLRFDPDNPRLPSTVNGRDEKAVLTWMLEDATIIELMGSIGEQGYFPGEPVLVVPSRTSDDSYEVVEGNRRLSAVKLLHNPELAPVRKAAVSAVAGGANHKPDSLPVLCYENRIQILAYLGYRHITGIKPWNPLAKAKYLSQLRELNSDLTFQDLARTIGSRADYVMRLLSALSVYDVIANEDFFDIRGLKEGAVDFSVLTTALSYSSIADFLGVDETGVEAAVAGLDKGRLKELTSWMFERDSARKTRLGESRNLKELSSIVANPKALEAFRAGRTLSDAHALTEAPAQIFRGALFEARNRLERARDYLHLVDEPTQAEADTLTEIGRIARSLRVAIEDQLREKEEI